MTDLGRSPCRGCDKELVIRCRNLCHKLKAYRKLAMETALDRSYEDQYTSDIYGVTKKIARKGVPPSQDDDRGGM